MQKIKGFTILELIIVIAIIVILGALSIPTYLNFRYRALDSECANNFASIFTDEMVFNSTNSIFISAGEIASSASSVPSSASSTASTHPHPFYMPADTHYIGFAPFYCNSNSKLTVNGYGIIAGEARAATLFWRLTPPSGSMENGGFANIGFYPTGSIYFYYGVRSNAPPNIALQTSLASYSAPGFTDGSCGAGFTAMAIANFTGSNLQEYAINDYSQTPILIYGTSY